MILCITKYDFGGSLVAFQLWVIFHNVYGAIAPNNAKPIQNAKKIMTKILNTFISGGTNMTFSTPLIF
jgi:hypothetical protein